jgi:hypothetical protein
MNDVLEFKNPLTWGDVSIATTVTIGAIIIGIVLFLVSNNYKVLLIVTIFIIVGILGFLLPTLLTSPSQIKMEKETFSIKTRFGRTLTYPYGDISFIKLSRGQSYKERYGVFRTTFQNYGRYFVRYEIAEALIQKCQESKVEMPRIEMGP